MKYTILLAMLALVTFVSGSPSPAKAPSTSADLSKKDIYEKSLKKRDGKKVKIEEEEEEEDEEEDGSDYEDEYYGKTPGFYGGIKGDPWKAKEGEKRFVKEEPKLPPFGFDFGKEKKHKIDGKEGEFDYPDPKFFYPGGIYKEIPFKKGDVPKENPFLKPEIPKDIYKKEKKGHKAPIKPDYDEEKFADIPFYGIPFMYGGTHKVHDAEEAEEEKVDPKLLYKQYMFGLGAKIPLYTFDPKLIYELIAKEKKLKSKHFEYLPKELLEADGKKKLHSFSKGPKEGTSTYKADIDAVKKSMKS